MVSKVRPKLGNLKIWSARQKRRRHRASPQQIISLRMNDFARLFNARYGTQLPDDDSGRDDIEVVAHHLAALPQPARRIAQWLELWAPWLTLAEQRTIVTDGIANARAWKADQIAWRFRVTNEERQRLGLTTIGAIDFGKAARTKRRKERDRQRKANERKMAGARDRNAFESQSLMSAKPWAAEGISRRTWYRRRLAQRGTGPATA